MCMWDRTINFHSTDVRTLRFFRSDLHLLRNRKQNNISYLQCYIFPFRQALHESSESLSGGFVTDVFPTSNLTAWLFQATSNLIAVGTSHGLALIFGKLKIKFRVFCILMILKKRQAKKQKNPGWIRTAGWISSSIFIYAKYVFLSVKKYNTNSILVVLIHVFLLLWGLAHWYWEL